MFTRHLSSPLAKKAPRSRERSRDSKPNVAELIGFLVVEYVHLNLSLQLITSACTFLNLFQFFQWYVTCPLDEILPIKTRSTDSSMH